MHLSRRLPKKSLPLFLSQIVRATEEALEEGDTPRGVTVRKAGAKRNIVSVSRPESSAQPCVNVRAA